MRDEPEIGGCGKSPFFGFWRRCAAPPVFGRGRAVARPRLGFCIFEIEEPRRWESGKPAFGFPLFHGLRRRRCGNVGISPAVGEISKGLVERVGSLPLAFHAFHSPGISTALSHRVLRQRASNASLAFCIRRAASVSLMAAALFCNDSAVIPDFKHFSHSGKDLSFS